MDNFSLAQEARRAAWSAENGREQSQAEGGGLRPLLKEGDAAQSMIGCMPGCFESRPHEHLVLEGAELLVDPLTDEVVSVRHLAAPSAGDAG